MFDLKATQAAIREFGFDGWLLFDFRGSNLLARRILDLDGKPTTSRRFYYFVPAEGEPIKLVHRIEVGRPRPPAGRSKRIYLRWQELEASLTAWSPGATRVAMEYSPRNNIPYISRVDAGTVEVIRGAGAEIVSSGDLIQRFEATWDDDQWAMHREAERVRRPPTTWPGRSSPTGRGTAARPRSSRSRRSSWTTSPAHRADHLQPADRGRERARRRPPLRDHPESATRPIRKGDYVLLDLWAKVDRPRAVYSDLTRVGLRRGDGPALYEDDLPDRRPGPRRGHRDRPRRLRGGPSAPGLGGRRRLPRGDRSDRVWPAVRPSHGPQHRPGSPRQRREHGQPGDARRTPRDAADLLLDRAGHLSRRLRHPQRGERVHRRRRHGPRHGRTRPGAGRSRCCRAVGWSPPSRFAIEAGWPWPSRRRPSRRRRPTSGRLATAASGRLPGGMKQGRGEEAQDQGKRRAGPDGERRRPGGAGLQRRRRGPGENVIFIRMRR